MINDNLLIKSIPLQVEWVDAFLWRPFHFCACEV